MDLGLVGLLSSKVRALVAFYPGPEDVPLLGACVLNVKQELRPSQWGCD